jgi:hypothetical protein
MTRILNGESVEDAPSSHPANAMPQPAVAS